MSKEISKILLNSLKGFRKTKTELRKSDNYHKWSAFFGIMLANKNEIMS